MRLEIHYRNEFNYHEPARESHNLLRACPATTEHQRLLEYRVEVAPEARVHSYTDYWGTRVDEFGIIEPHTSLRVEAHATVETTTPPAPTEDPPFDGLGGPVLTELSTYLRPSPHSVWERSVADAANQAVAEHREGVVGAVTAIADKVTGNLEYAPGATYVGMDVADVLGRGKGVCQDFAHLTIAMCRSIGIPARYISGYLYAADQTEAVAPDRPELEVQTHAWVEVFVPDHGWWALDPTNPQPVGELHVKIGHGRDYEDVMPLRGVYHGEAEHDLGVQVRISRDRLSEQVEQ